MFAKFQELLKLCYRRNEGSLPRHAASDLHFHTAGDRHLRDGERRLHRRRVARRDQRIERRRRREY